MMTVNELSKLAGISVRTLHYYDSIGLLHPAKISESGYRMYDDENLKRLQQIMLFRELEFSLKEIKNIIDDPNFDKEAALDEQINLLTMKRDHLDLLIEHARKMKLKEELKMDFKAFDTSKIEAYKKVAKETWGDTKEYKEYEEKSQKQSDIEKRQAAEDLMNIFFEFGNMKDLPCDAKKVQAQVKKLQDHISAKYYKCTNVILKGLAQIYIAGGDMTRNIDAAGGKGTAEFVAKAIDEYCK